MWVHNLDPFVVQFPDWWIFRFLHLAGDGIRWYGLAYIAGFVCGFLAIRYMARKGTTPVREGDAADFITLVAVGTMVGGRLGYCLFYAPDLLTDFNGHFPYWGVLRVYEGGMASHGGILGIIFVCIWWARRHKVDVFHALDLVTLGGSIGIFFGRIANFINGELWGREAPGVSWAMKFPSEMYIWTRSNVMKLLDVTPAVTELGEIQTRHGEIVKLNAETWKNWVEHYRTDSQSWSLVNEVVEQLIQSIQSGNEKVRALIEPALAARYPSQLIEASLEGLLIFAILALVWRKPRKPGIISAIFGMTYAIVRIIGEQFRMPDAHIGYEWLGLTRGQWLSVGMLVAVSLYTFYVLRRPGKPMGGWNKSV